ncbi:MAG TPA: hypothetical protein VFN44_10845 [Solirubrobacteraceae bacterium]|nr:hypothetical protein [Solirubrobacteraceae bacterium]
MYEHDDLSRGQGFVTFAGVMIMIAGVLNTIYGIAAIDKATFFTDNAKYVFADLKTFGWFVLILGVLQIFAAVAIWNGSGWGRWFGVACASANMILQMLWIPSAPFLAITILVLDILALYGLLVYGGQRRRMIEAEERAARAAAAS